MRVVDDHGGPVRTVVRRGELIVAVMDSVAFASAEHAGQLIVTGSHGGASAGEYARRGRVAAVACNDAGIGKDDAGVAGLAALDDVVGVAVGHETARIGDGPDTWESGIVSYANRAALAAGVQVGEPLAEAFTRLATEWGHGC
ncbi:hypothetical protein [Amycolatopsis jejuensis]|uniref:hypothetical protein n=1 Tax=Amycolatopsis jejuensis TaxID=330084 RepID=UPI0005269206|nr:hypothetical protein [Amycolatopsis jejuensis]